MTLAIGEEKLARRASNKSHILKGATGLPVGIYILYIPNESVIIQFGSVISNLLILLKERHVES